VYGEAAVVGFSHVPLRLAHGLNPEGGEKPGAMPISTEDEPSERGRLAASISTGVVHAFTEHTGRGPTRARTTIDGDLVVVILQDGQTKAERALVRAGKGDTVLRLRRAFQETMRDDLIGIVEGLTQRTVHAFMSANHNEPDAAAEIFILDGDPHDGRPHALTP
jgi:uncharacterized protein YbcI